MSMTHSVYMFTHRKPVYYNVRYDSKNGEENKEGDKSIIFMFIFLMIDLYFQEKKWRAIIM